MIEDDHGDKKTFEYDRAYWSHDPQVLGGSSQFITQALLYEDLGKVMLDVFFGGMSVTMFAYGQTGILL